MRVGGKEAGGGGGEIIHREATMPYEIALVS